MEYLDNTLVWQGKKKGKKNENEKTERKRTRERRNCTWMLSGPCSKTRARVSRQQKSKTEKQMKRDKAKQRNSQGKGQVDRRWDKSCPCLEKEASLEKNTGENFNNKP
jgi:hypothetical protein